MKRYCATLLCGLLLVAAGTASAGVDLGLKGIGIRAGMVNPEELDATVGFGIFADLGTFHPNVSFETYAGYWSKSIDVGFGESSFRDIAIGAKTEYMFAVGDPRIHPFVGGGLSLHMLHSEATIPEIDMGGGFVIPAMSLDASDTKVGFDIGGGLRAGVHDSIDIVGEAWYTLISDFNQLGVSAGLVYKLPY